MNFGPDLFDRNIEQKVDQDTARVGVRYSPSPRSNVLGSVIYNNRDLNTVSTSIPELRSGADGFQGEGEYLFDGEIFKLATGFSTFDVDRNRRLAPVP